jgi:beta-carotene hydroxylase
VTRAPPGPLRFAVDRWSLAYLAAASALYVVHRSLAEVHWPLVAVACAMAYGVGCILHDHAHLPMWRSRLLNGLTEIWIVLLRGDGVWSWLPTHVGNHHLHANRRGDLTLTWRWSGRNDLPGLVAYTATGCVLYGGSALRHLARTLRARPRRGLMLIAQVALYATFVVSAVRSDAHRALWLILVPQGFGVVAMIATGYMQHHHADEHSTWSHSRDFVGRLNNLLHFNHGFHTVHHVDRRLHWSEWPRAHALVADRLDPRLIEPSLPRYLARVFLGAPLHRRWASIDLSCRSPGRST